jgi:DNA-directed RNA polymerase subunit alpha
VLTSTSDEDVILRLDVRGPATITAGDIKCPSEIEILNKDQHIATLNARPAWRRPHGRPRPRLPVERP